MPKSGKNLEMGRTVLLKLCKQCYKLDWFIYRYHCYYHYYYYYY